MKHSKIAGASIGGLMREHTRLARALNCNPHPKLISEYEKIQDRIADKMDMIVECLYEGLLLAQAVPLGVPADSPWQPQERPVANDRAAIVAEVLGALSNAITGISEKSWQYIDGDVVVVLKYKDVINAIDDVERKFK